MIDPLRQYDPPALLDDFPRDPNKRQRFRKAWDARLNEWIGGGASPDGNFYDPKETLIGDAQPVRVEWNVFPKEIEDAPDRNPRLPPNFGAADRRPTCSEAQIEYGEWCIQRDPETKKITRVTFTTEAPEYWQTLWRIDRERVVALYREHVNHRVRLEDLQSNGDYDPQNKWNTGNEYLPDSGGSMHMVVGANTLSAAVGVVAGAANSPNDAPQRGPFRADALVVLSVARVVLRLGMRLSFSNPVGIYLQEPEWNRFELPTGAPREANPQDFWQVVRGRREKGQGLRAVFEVPRNFGFQVGDIKIDGQDIKHGSQIARAVQSGTYVTPLPRS